MQGSPHGASGRLLFSRAGGKFAADAFSRCLAAEVTAFKVRVLAFFDMKMLMESRHGSDPMR